MGIYINTNGFIDGYAIYCEREWFKEGWDRWCEEKYNIVNEKHIKQLDKDYAKIELLSSQTKSYYKINSGTEIGLLSSTLEEVLPVTGKILRSILYDGYLHDDSSNSLFGVSFSVVFPFFYKNYCIITSHGNKGILDLDGRYVIPPVYEKLEIIDENKVVANLNSKFGLINFNESVLIDFIYDRMEFIGNNYFIVRTNNLEGVLNLLHPEELVLKEIKYHTYSENTVLVSKMQSDGEEKFGAEDCFGNILIPLDYDYLSKFENGIAIATIKNKNGLINKKNQYIQSLKTDSIKRIELGYFLTYWKNKFGLLKPDGSMLLQPQFSKIIFQNSCFLIEKDNQYNYLNFNGEFEHKDWQQDWLQEYDDSYTKQEIDDMYRKHAAWYR